MDLIAKAQIEQAFNDHLVLMFNEKPAVLKFIQNHERKTLCLENLMVAIDGVEANSPVILKKEHVLTLAQEYAHMFAKAALDYEEQQQMHYLEKKKIMEEQAILDEILSDETDSTQVLK